MLAKDVIRQIRRIEIKTRRIVNESLAGRYQSVFKGQGMEFDEVRPYQVGDDTRGIDWNVTARMGTPHVKRFVEERELTVMLLVDMSGSTEFGSTARAKRDLAAELTSLFAYSAIQNHDKVGCIIFTDRIELHISPKKGKNHVLRLIREILTLEPEGLKTDIGAALRYFSRVNRRRCVVFLISDFMDHGFAKAMQAVQVKHDLIALPILDRRELEPPDRGLFALEDGEEGTERFVDFGSARVRNAFQARADSRIRELEALFVQSKVDHVNLMCGGPYEERLVRFFRMREMRR